MKVQIIIHQSSIARVTANKRLKLQPHLERVIMIQAYGSRNRSDTLYVAFENCSVGSGLFLAEE